MALIELKEFFLSHDAAYNYEILGPGFTFPDLFTLALLSLFFFELVMPGRHHGTIQPQTAEPLRSARRRLLARNGFRTPHGICFPAGVAKGPAVLPADGNSALHPIHRRLLPLRPDSHRPLLHPLLPGDRPGLLVHGAHPPAMAAVDVGTAGLLPAFIHHHHSIFQQYLVHHSHLYPDTYRLGYPLRLHPAIPHPGHYPGLLGNRSRKKNPSKKIRK